MAGEERRKLYVLTTNAFLLALCLLLLNDFVLKPWLGNWLTGKLSDFAGLFVFPLFWSALFPRFRRAVYLLTAASFVLWKSAYSQPPLDLWNGLGLLPLGRIVDASDLLALLVLPVSFLHFGRAERRPPRRLAPYLVAAVSVFAFTATSYRTQFPYDNKYPFQMSRTELTRRVFNLGRLNKEYRENYRARPCGFAGGTLDGLEVNIPSEFCFHHISATVGIGEENGQGFIALKEMGHQCPEEGDDKAKLLSIFEKDFIGRLGQSSPAFPADELPEVPPARSDQPGALYLVAFGETPGVNMKDVASDLSRALGTKVRVLPSLTPSEAAGTSPAPAIRPQAEQLVAHMRAVQRKLADDPRVVLIGVTQDFYAQSGSEPYPSHYVEAGRLGVVSLDALNPKTFCEPEDVELLRSRLRKVLASLYHESPAPPAR